MTMPTTSAWGALVPTLLACLHQDPKAISAAKLQTLSPSDWQTLRALAADQRVQPLLYHRLRSKGLSDAVPAEALNSLHKALQRNTMRNMRILSEFKEIASALQGKGIPVIVLKGLYLATSVYESLGLREMNDIDLMVPRHRVAQAAETLMALGYQPLRHFVLENDMAVGHHLTRLIKPGVLAVEIHWDIARPGQSYTIDSAELWERARSLHIAGKGVLVLSPEDTVLHLCLHTSYQHRFEFGLRPSCDLATMAQRFGSELDWPAVEERTLRWGWQRGVYLALRLAGELVGAEIPEPVAHTLQPQAFDEAIVAVGRNQVFSQRRITRELSPNLARFFDGDSLREKILRMLRIILPSPTFLAKQYGVPVHSARVYLYYPQRWWDIFQNNKASLWGLLWRDSSLMPVADRKNILGHWLE